MSPRCDFCSTRQRTPKLMLFLFRFTDRSTPRERVTNKDKLPARTLPSREAIILCQSPAPNAPTSLGGPKPLSMYSSTPTHTLAEPRNPRPRPAAATPVVAGLPLVVVRAGIGDVRKPQLWDAGGVAHVRAAEGLVLGRGRVHLSSRATGGRRRVVRCRVPNARWHTAICFSSNYLLHLSRLFGLVSAPSRNLTRERQRSIVLGLPKWGIR